MQLQTFQGSTMAEALQRVKTTLGHDAVILHTRTVHHKRWMGLRKTELFEITAGRGVNVVKRQVPARPAPSHPPAHRAASRHGTACPAFPDAPVTKTLIEISLWSKNNQTNGQGTPPLELESQVWLRFWDAVSVSRQRHASF